MKTNLLGFLLLFLASSTGQGAGLSEALQQGLLEEEANQNLTAAVQAYQSVLNQFDEQRKIAATAAFRLGEAYRKQGKTNEALAQFERVVREFGDQGTVVQLSQRYLADAARAQRGTALGAGLGSSVPTLSREETQLLGEEIALVEQLLAEAEKRSVDRADPREILQIKRQLIPLQRKLPENADPSRQEALINQEIGLVQELLGRMQTMIEAGRASPIDQFALKRDLIGLQHELRAVRTAAEPSFQTRLNTIVKRAGDEGGSQFQNRLNTIVRSAASGEIPNDEEAKEIERIQEIINNSPDLINERKGVRGETMLHGAAQKGQLRLARFLLDNGAEVNAVSGSEHASEATPLHNAARSGHKAVVELLLSRGAALEGKDRFGQTALHYAARQGFQAVAQTLLEKGADVNAKNSSGETPLQLAIAGKHKGMIEFLLANKADVNAQNDMGGTPLMYAAGSKQPEIVKLLLSHKADVHVREKEGSTALTAAVLHKTEQIVELLLQHGADPNVNGIRERQIRIAPLHQAASEANIPLAQLLLKNRADVNLQDEIGRTPLHHAVINGSLPTVKLLLAHGAKPNIQDQDGRTPLLLAAEAGRTEVIPEIVRHQADVNLGDKNGRTPLLLALTLSANSDSLVQAKRWLVESLLAHRADPNQKGMNGYTPLHVAAASWSVDLVKLLLSKGADVNAQDDFGNTPLHYAVYEGAKAVVETLLAHEAKPDLKNRDGATPLEMMKHPGYGRRALGVPLKTGEPPGVPRSVRVERGLNNFHQEIISLLMQDRSAR